MQSGGKTHSRNQSERVETHPLQQGGQRTPPRSCPTKWVIELWSFCQKLQSGVIVPVRFGTAPGFYAAGYFSAPVRWMILYFMHGFKCGNCGGCHSYAFVLCDLTPPDSCALLAVWLLFSDSLSCWDVRCWVESCGFRTTVWPSECLLHLHRLIMLYNFYILLYNVVWVTVSLETISKPLT